MELENMIKEESLVMNNAIPQQWFEKEQVKMDSDNKEELMQTDFVEIDIENTEKEQNLAEIEEKDEEMYQNIKPEKDPFSQFIEESDDPYVKKNYMDLDKFQVNSPLRSSLASQYFKEHSLKKNESPLFPMSEEKKKDENLKKELFPPEKNKNFEKKTEFFQEKKNEGFSPNKQELFSENKVDFFDEKSLKKAAFSPVSLLVRNQKKEKKSSILDCPGKSG
jgi:hypothetical protein